MLDKVWSWHKNNQQTKQEFNDENNLIEGKRYWLNEFDEWRIDKDRYKIEVDKLELNFKQHKLHSWKPTKGEIAWDLLVKTISWTVSWIFKMSWVGKKNKK